MNMYDVITKKKNNKKLTKTEIEYFIDGFNKGSIPDYQASALLMAICINGMDAEESTNLTLSIVNTGEVLDISDEFKFSVDKHSTGGVADTTSLIVTPILASIGLTVAKMSGRGLGHTGGTIDKLESFPGFEVELTNKEFIKQLKKINLALVSQTDKLAPADKKLYSLRDVTATINSIPLIASSIMSKKIASGAKSIILDVKYGNGAFMETLEEAKKLAELMVEIGKSVDRNMVALISDMNNPLGMAIGNTIEVIEAIEILKGKYVPRLSELCKHLVTELLLVSSYCQSEEEAHKLYDKAIKSGRALEAFKKLVDEQSGDSSYIDDPSQFLKAKYSLSVKSNADGYISRIDALKLGKVAMDLGAGRKVKEDDIDMQAGIILNKHVYQKVIKDEVIATLYSNSNINSKYQKDILESFHISTLKPKESSVIKKIIK
ncbi:MAG: thymidine phosphorylase [Clostridia bacterium]